MTQLNCHIKTMNFSTRTYNCLVNANILSLQQLAEKDEMEIRSLSHLGEKSFHEIKDKLKEFGIDMKKAQYIDNFQELKEFLSSKGIYETEIQDNKGGRLFYTIVETPEDKRKNNPELYEIHKIKVNKDGTAVRGDGVFIAKSDIENFWDKWGYKVIPYGRKLNEARQEEKARTISVTNIKKWAEKTGNTEIINNMINCLCK